MTDSDAEPSKRIANTTHKTPIRSHGDAQGSAEQTPNGHLLSDDVSATVNLFHYTLGCTVQTTASHISNLGDLASVVGLHHLAGILTSHPLSDFAELLLSPGGRPSVLARLQQNGVDRLSEREALANEISRAVRQGALTQDGELPIDFRAALQRMPEAAQQVLTDTSLACVAADKLLAALQEEASADTVEPPASSHASDLLIADGALSAAGCSALRQAVDTERSVAKDSVDKGAEHQLDLSVAQLEELVGASDLARLMAVILRMRLRQRLRLSRRLRLRRRLRRTETEA
uniref:Uncharacterized protein n=1 Tax=Haptolina brevifila TaxID=156173 RepID=A0A7S2MBE1_9EUKA